MNFILDNLAIGNYQEALEPPPGIDALLCVAQERDIDKSTHLYDKVPIIDMQPIPTEQLKEAVEWIRDNISNHKIMVFCNEGVGRSPSVVVAYLCCGLGYSFGDAVEYVATRKPYMSILPNLIVSIEETRISNIKDFLKEKSRIIQRKKPKPIILSWLNSDSMKDSLRIIDKKVHYLRKKSGSGGQGKLKQWFLSDDNDFLNITAERYIIDYLRMRNSNIEDNLRKKGIDAEINCDHEKIGIEITTLNGFVAAWILQERLMEFFDEKQFRSEKTLTLKYSIERVRNEEQKNNIYNYIENIGNAITNADVASLKKMEIEINVENRNNACIVWEHDRDENYPWFRYLTSDLLRKLSEPNKQGQLNQNQKNIIFVGINEFAPPNKVIPRIFKEIGYRGISYQTEINGIKEYWEKKLQKHQNITGICYFYYSLVRETPFYPLKIFWRNATDKIQFNL